MKRIDIRVDPIGCAGHGLCAELLPERIRLDDWGYPIVDDEPLSAELMAHARRAADACPTLALTLQARRRSRSESPPMPTSVAALRRAVRARAAGRRGSES